MRRAAVAAVAGLLLLASCTSNGSTTTSSDGAVTEHARIKVDTAALRSQKAAAGIATCRPGRSSSGLPRVTLPCLGGGPALDLAKLRGPLVLNLFAPWCGPCRKELPYYQALSVKGKGKLRVLGVDYLDTQPRKALQLARQSGVTYPLVADPAGVLRKDFKVRFLPGIVFVDARGKVTAVQFKQISSYAELRQLVRQQLGVDLPA